MVKKLFFGLFLTTFCAAAFCGIEETSEELNRCSADVWTECIDPCIGEHTIVDAYAAGHPCSEEYSFVLDNDSVWIFPSDLYAKNNMALCIGDVVSITFLGSGAYSMTIPSTSVKQIIFERATCGVKCFYALKIE